MDLFRSLSDAELDDAIKSLALQIASGATQIASPDAGSATYVGRNQAIQILRSLERSRARRLGLPVDPSDKMRVTRIVTVNDYHQR